VGVVFADQRNSFRGSHSALFDVDWTGIWTIDFFNPQLLGWLQGVVGVLHPSYCDHQSSLGDTRSVGGSGANLRFTS